jgi:hypothetical protein
MDPELIPLIELFIAAIAAAIAFIQNRKKKTAERETAVAKAETAAAEDRTMDAEDRAAQVVSFFDPADETVTVAPAGIPARSYRMSDETKRWLTFDLLPGEQQALLQQIAEAEEQGRTSYRISVPGCSYEIEYGLVKGGEKGG